MDRSFVRTAFAFLILAPFPAFAEGASDAHAGGAAGVTLGLALLIPFLALSIWLRLKIMRFWMRLFSSLLGLEPNARPQGMPTRRGAQFARIERDIDGEAPDVGSVDRSIAALLAERNKAAAPAASAEPPQASRSGGFGRRVA